ncbi:hypothetical protein EC912_1178, partial [Luteibacter rhizovicinus]
MSRFPLIGATTLLVVLTGCSTLPQPRDDGSLQREAIAGTEQPVPPSLAVGPVNPPRNGGVAVAPEIVTGSGQFVRPQGLAKPKPVVA